MKKKFLVLTTSLTLVMSLLGNAQVDYAQSSPEKDMYFQVETALRGMRNRIVTAITDPRIEAVAIYWAPAEDQKPFNETIDGLAKTAIQLIPDGKRSDVAIKLIKNFAEVIKKEARPFLEQIAPLMPDLVRATEYSHKKSTNQEVTRADVLKYGETVHIQRKDGTFYQCYAGFSKSLWPKVARVTAEADLFLAQNRPLSEMHNFTLFAFLMGDQDVTHAGKPVAIYPALYDYLDRLSKDTLNPEVIRLASVALHAGKETVGCYEEAGLGKVFFKKPDERQINSNHVNIKKPVRVSHVFGISEEELNKIRAENPPYIFPAEELEAQKAEQKRLLEAQQRAEAEARALAEARRLEEQRLREKEEARVNAPVVTKIIFEDNREIMKKISDKLKEIEFIQSDKDEHGRKKERKNLLGYPLVVKEMIMDYSRGYEQVNPRNFFDSIFQTFLNPAMGGVLDVSKQQDLSTLKEWLLQKYKDLGGEKPDETINYIFDKFNVKGVGYNVLVPALSHFHGFVTVYGQDLKYQEDIQSITADVMIKMQDHLNHCGDGARGRGFLIDWAIIQAIQKGVKA